MSADTQSYSLDKVSMENTLAGFCTAGTVVNISWSIGYSPFGIDFTEESVYLVRITKPFLYDGSITRAGFVYHPLYRRLSVDIANLSQANILITFYLAQCLAYSFRASLVTDLKESRFPLPVSTSLATTAFIFFNSWLLTPTYSSLNLKGLLIAVTGFVLADKNADRKSITGRLLIGLGWWLATKAKPNTALTVAVGVFIHVFFASKLSLRMQKLRLEAYQ